MNPLITEIIDTVRLQQRSALPMTVVCDHSAKKITIRTAIEASSDVKDTIKKRADTDVVVEFEVDRPLTVE